MNIALYFSLNHFDTVRSTEFKRKLKKGTKLGKSFHKADLRHILKFPSSFVLACAEEKPNAPIPLFLKPKYFGECVELLLAGLEGCALSL